MTRAFVTRSRSRVIVRADPFEVRRLEQLHLAQRVAVVPPELERRLARLLERRRRLSPLAHVECEPAQ